jgi:exodeoxyribonuclease-1
LNDADKVRVQAVASADERNLADLQPQFQDERLSRLLLHYKARNFPRTLGTDEIKLWEQWRIGRLQRQLPEFMKSLERLGKQELDESKQFIVQELQLWLESIAPTDVSDPSSPD